MNLRWDDLRLFLAVYEQGSLSGAARLLRLGQPTLSRRIAELEQVLGEALFVRQSQGMSLSSAGQKLLPAAQRMAEWASEAAAGIGQHAHLPQGRVRIAAPPLVAYELVAPLAAQIRQQYPAIQIELLVGVDTLNLSRGEADLSLRTSPPNDADLICLDQLSSAFGVFVSPAYAQRLPAKVGMSDLDWISWAAPYEQLVSHRQLLQNIPDFQAAFCANDVIVQLAACKAGVGAMLLPQILHRLSRLNELQQLQQLEIDLGPAAVGELYLVCHKRHRYLPKVQLVSDCLRSEFARLRQSR